MPYHAINATSNKANQTNQAKPSHPPQPTNPKTQQSAMTPLFLHPSFTYAHCSFLLFTASCAAAAAHAVCLSVPPPAPGKGGKEAEERGTWSPCPGVVGGNGLQSREGRSVHLWGLGGASKGRHLRGAAAEAEVPVVVAAAAAKVCNRA